MPERPSGIRSEDHRHKQRIRRLMPEGVVKFSIPVIVRAPRQEVRLQIGRPVVVTMQDGISFREQVGRRVDVAGRISAVDGLDGREPILAPPDVQEAARADECRECRRPWQHIRVVEPVDLIELHDVIVEPVEHDAIGERIHRLAAPPERVGQRAELRRDERRNTPHRLFHFVVLIAQIDPALLLSELSAQVVDAVFHGVSPLHEKI